MMMMMMTLMIISASQRFYEENKCNALRVLIYI